MREEVSRTSMTVEEEVRKTNKPTITIVRVEAIKLPAVVTQKYKAGPRSRKRVLMEHTESETRDTSDMDVGEDRSEISSRSTKSVRELRSSNTSVKKKKTEKRGSQTEEVKSSDDESRCTVISSEDEFEPPKSPRGRKPTTGEGVCKRRIEEKKKYLKDLGNEIKELEKIAQGQHNPAEYRKESEYQRMRDLEQEMKALPTRDIVAQIITAANQIHGTAVKSKRIKGTLVKVLKDSAMLVQVGVDAISGRANPREGVEQRELHELRDELKRVRMERDTLQNMMEQKPESTTQGVEHNPPMISGEGYKATEAEEEEERARPSTSFLQKEMEKWPALRPEVQGKRKVLEDKPLESRQGTFLRPGKPGRTAAPETIRQRDKRIRLPWKTWTRNSINF